LQWFGGWQYLYWHHLQQRKKHQVFRLILISEAVESIAPM
jgi:hypothetical protein